MTKIVDNFSYQVGVSDFIWNKLVPDYFDINNSDFLLFLDLMKMLKEIKSCQINEYSIFQFCF